MASASVTTRPLTADDIPDLAVEVDRARAADEFSASSDPDAEFFLKSVPFDPSIVVGAFDGDELVGFLSAEFKIAVVRPTRRRQGIGRALVERAIDVERARRRDVVLLGILPGRRDQRSFVEATGFGFHSTLWDLDLPPGTAVSDPVWPDGLVQRTFDRARDLEPWVELFNRAFADHATPLQLDPSFVAAGFDDPAIVDEDTAIIEDVATAQLVGFCATSPVRRDGIVLGHGEIWTIGVRPERQGAGLGRQLLRWGALRLRSIGVRDVSLSVNGRNERALGLYESEGFVRSRTRERWARDVPAAAVGAGSGAGRVD